MSSHYHNYQIINDTPQAIVEVCKECKHRLVTKKDRRGAVDTKKYLKEHVRDTAQPTGITAPIFKRYYGDNKAKKGS